VNRPSTTTITTINNNNTTTVTVRPTPPRGGGRGPVIVNNGPRGGGRGPIIVTARPRVMPGLVGGTTIVAGGFVPSMAAAPADPAVVEVPVPVYIPQPAAPTADPVAVEPVAADPVASTTPTPALRLTERHLRITNNTGERLTVYVQHLSRTATGEWAWLPADPRADAKAEEFQVEAGADAVLATAAGELTAQTVRLWAVSESGREWADYKDADLPLVPETDAAGNHTYVAAAVGTFTMNFDK
jgi:hypothetical protein